MAAFNNVENICYLHRSQYYWQYSYKSIFTHGPTKLSNRNCITSVPTIHCDLFNKSNIDHWQG